MCMFIGQQHAICKNHYINISGLYWLSNEGKSDLIPACHKLIHI